MNDKEFQAFLGELKRYDGVLWLRILGETHWQYDEIPFWVLVSGPEQVEPTILKLREALRPLQGLRGANVTLAINTVRDRLKCQYVMYHGEELFRDDALDQVYDDPDWRERRYGLFDAVYPDDPWSMPQP